jgi:hypothetical protein
LLVGTPRRIRTHSARFWRPACCRYTSDVLSGRGRGIRTPDPLLPKQMRYQTALYPELVGSDWQNRTALPTAYETVVTPCVVANTGPSVWNRTIIAELSAPCSATELPRVIGGLQRTRTCNLPVKSRLL